jgi:hypothetical protein
MVLIVKDVVPGNGHRGDDRESEIPVAARRRVVLALEGASDRRFNVADVPGFEAIGR